jgi:hypothetical protein
MTLATGGLRVLVRLLKLSIGDMAERPNMLNQTTWPGTVLKGRFAAFWNHVGHRSVGYT